MPATTPDGLRYPVDLDTADGPTAFQNLATDTQAALNKGGRSFSNAATRDAFYSVVPPAEGGTVHLQDVDSYEQWINGIWQGRGDLIFADATRSGDYTDATWTIVPLGLQHKIGRTFSVNGGGNIVLARNAVIEFSISASWAVTGDSYTISARAVSAQLPSATWLQHNVFVDRAADYTRAISTLQVDGAAGVAFAPQLLVPFVLPTLASSKFQVVCRVLRHY